MPRPNNIRQINSRQGGGGYKKNLQGRSQPAKKRGWFWLYALIWALTLVMFTAVILTQMSGYNNYRAELAKVQADIAAEELERENLLNEQVYNESDAYIEQQAREQLGLVRPDEILFINEAE